jgi:hypothetical protein
MKIPKTKIRSAQNVGKVWISKKKTPGPFGAISEQLFYGPNKCKHCIICLVFFLGGPMAAIFLGGPHGPTHTSCEEDFGHMNMAAESYSYVFGFWDFGLILVTFLDHCSIWGSGGV